MLADVREGVKGCVKGGVRGWVRMAVEPLPRPPHVDFLRCGIRCVRGC